jgi:hypothetical protein
MQSSFSGELDIGFFPFVETDLSTLQGVKKVFDECLKRFGTVDIVMWVSTLSTLIAFCLTLLLYHACLQQQRGDW